MCAIFVWYLIFSFPYLTSLLLSLPSSFDLNPQHPFEVAICCRNLVLNLPLHSYYSGLLVNCRFFIERRSELIHRCCLKLPCCKRVQL